MAVARLGENVANQFVKAFRNNNVGFIANELERRGLKRQGIAPLSEKRLRFLTVILGIASAMSWKDGWMTERMKLELIERVAGHVDIFKFVKALIGYEDTENISLGYAIDTSVVPVELRDALILNDYNSEIAATIMQLDEEVLRSLLVFICANDEIKILNCKFSVPIACAIFANGLVPDDVLFMLLAGHLCERPYRAN